MKIIKLLSVFFVLYLNLCIYSVIPLFEQYKGLASTLPYISLAVLPTPIMHAQRLGNAIGHAHIFIKRDDLTGVENALYGGNKVRKLEFLLADAQQKRATHIITVGATGSNHALATACHAQRCGFTCTLLLIPQAASPIVRQNLLLDHYYNAHIEIFNHRAEKEELLEKIYAQYPDAYFIPVGGSTPLGAIGYVNAAFELKAQIDEGLMPEPSYIYVPTGSFGTVAGLLLGCALAGLKTTIIAVSIEPHAHTQDVYNALKVLFEKTLSLLQAYDPAIPSVVFPAEQLIINEALSEPGYGRWTSDVDDAMRCIKEQEHVQTEGTYSGKAVAALIRDIKNNTIDSDAVVLLWETYCGLDFSLLTNTVHYKDLNELVHYYFAAVNC